MTNKTETQPDPGANPNPVTGPGPTTFTTPPANPPTPNAEAVKTENTTKENVGPLPVGKHTAERIIRHWDGGERIIATRMAQEATKAEAEKAAKARPELRTYIAGDVA